MPKSDSPTMRPRIRFMWWAASGEPRSLRISRTYSGRMKKAMGLSGGGRYERVGEFTASSMSPRQEIWMRSGIAFTTVPCSTLRSPMIRATASDAGCQRSSARGADWMTRPLS